MASCILCKSKEVIQSWDILIKSLHIRQVFNICDVCASIEWMKFKYSETMQSIIINPSYTKNEFKSLATENNSVKYGSNWCEYSILSPETK